MGEKAVVTGGLGLQGSKLALRLLDKGYEVTVIDNLRRGKRENIPRGSGARVKVLDLRWTSVARLAEIMAGASVVFHLAAHVGGVEHAQLNDREMLHDNLLSDGITIHAARKANVEKFVFPSTACFPAGEVVLANPEPRLIQEVSKGERVMDTRGESTKVLVTGKRWYEGELVGIKVDGLPEIRATPEHPFMTGDHMGHTSWVKAGDLSVGQSLRFLRFNPQWVIPKWLTVRGRKVRVKGDIAWLLGIYVAEGWVEERKYQKVLNFAFGEELQEIERTVSALESLGFSPKVRPSSGQKGAKVVVCDTKGVGVFKDQFGSGAANKSLPNWVFHLPDDDLAELLKGCIQGDGNIYTRSPKRLRISMATASKTLGWQLYTLLTRFNVLPSIHCFKGQGTIQGRGVTTNEMTELYLNGAQARSMLASLGTPMPRTRGRSFSHTKLIRGQFGKRIKALRRFPFSGYVYNMETQTSHTYNVMGAVVHNCVYPISKQTKWNSVLKEDDAFNPVEPENGYGWSKLTAELLLSKEDKMKVGILRLFNVYGPGEDETIGTSHVIPELITKALNGGARLQVFGDGSQGRAFLYATDAVDAYVRCMEKGCIGRPINIGTEKPIRIRDLAAMILDMTERKEIFFDTSKPTGVTGRVPDTTRAKKILGWHPKVSLEDGLKETVEFYRSSL